MGDWENRNIVIVGAARQGLALARFLSERGAHVTLNDKRLPGEIQESVQAMLPYPITWQLGHHSPDLLQNTDMVCVSAGVPLTLPLIQEAVRRGIPLSNDSQIFMENVGCKVIGITGSAGKTTTTTLLGRMAEHAVHKPQQTWVGGNIGRPLIDLVKEIRPDDLVVLEFSSFQLELMDRSPHISAILNITPNHLDRHGTMDAYARIKSRIFQFQQPEDWAILGFEDPITWEMRKDIPGRLATFAHENPGEIPAAYIHDGSLMISGGSQAHEVMPVNEVGLKGDHNLLNILAACSIAQAAGIPAEAMRAGISGFSGVPHRLEYIRTYQGAQWYNGSKATTPESAMVAIRSFSEPKIVLLGGRDKHLPWDRLAELAHNEIDHVIAFGEAAPIVLDALKLAGQNDSQDKKLNIEYCTGLQDAVLRAAELAQPGDVVLLAPGGTSFDEFNNYEERGERFKEWVNNLS